MISTPGSGRTFAIAFTEGGLYRESGGQGGETGDKEGEGLGFDFDRYYVDDAVADVL